MRPDTDRSRNASNCSRGEEQRLSRRPLAIGLGSLALVALIIACEQQLLPTATSNSEEPIATILTLNAGDRVVIGLGTSVRFYVTARDSLGNPVTDYVISWTSSDPSIVNVDDLGSATGLTLGSASLTVSAEKKPGSRGQGKSGAPGQLKKNIDVIVDPVPVASVEVIPDQAALEVESTYKLTAITRDANGNELKDRVVGWSSSNDAVAPVDEQGTVTGSAPGSATVTATSEGVDGDAAISVSAPSPIVDAAVWPIDVNLQPGQQAQFYAAFLHADSTVTCVPESPSTDPNVLFNATLVAGCDSATVLLDLSTANGTSGAPQAQWSAARAARVIHLPPGGDDY